MYIWFGFDDNDDEDVLNGKWEREKKMCIADTDDDDNGETKQEATAWMHVKTMMIFVHKSWFDKQ